MCVEAVNKKRKTTNCKQKAACMVGYEGEGERGGFSGEVNDRCTHMSSAERSYLQTLEVHCMVQDISNIDSQ